MDKMTHTKFNLNNFLMSLSSSLDNTIQNNKFNIKYSSKRVAYIAVNIASKQNISPQEISDIFSYSIIYANQTAKNNLDTFPFNAEDLQDNKTINNIVKIAYEIEQSLDIQDNIIINKENIISLFSSSYTDELFNTINFWFDLTSSYQLPFFTFNHLHDFTQELEFTKLIALSHTINDIIYSYSKREYTIPIDSRCKKICDFYAFDSKDSARMIIASNLINLGLLHIPQHILQKNKKLTNNEMDIMKSVPYHTNSILYQVFGFDDIALLASSAYERLDGSGYPNKLKANNLSLKNRVIAVLNIYQALCEKRPYRNIINSYNIIEIINSKENEGKVDNTVTIGFIEDN